MTRVVVKDGNIDKAWSEFKFKFAHSGVPSKVKEHREYKKPGVKRAEKKAAGIRKARKAGKTNRKVNRKK